MSEPSFQTYLFEYDHNGSTWVLEIKAPSLEDAEARVQRLPWARYVGELKMTVPVQMEWLVRLICWFKNT